MQTKRIAQNLFCDVKTVNKKLPLNKTHVCIYIRSVCVHIQGNTASAFLVTAKYPTGATGVSVQPFVDLENKKGTDTSSVRPETEAQSAPR